MGKTSDIHELTNILAKALRHKIGAMVNSNEIYAEKYAKDADLLIKEAKKIVFRQNWNSYDKSRIKNELRKKLRLELEKKDFLDDRKFDMMDEEMTKVLKELELA
ncbi:MAG: hypothetical protein Q8L29_03000 [archaeon]|nr:hypothetical protein [archaeon]